MPSCSVKWCSNHTSTCSLKSKNGVSFHRFPKDEALCKKWVEAVRLERRDPWWTSSNASRICSLHFKESDITPTPCKVNVLAKNAVPICTMVWYDDNENIKLEITNDKTDTAKTILKTYERKRTHMNVLKESKVNMSNEMSAVNAISDEMKDVKPKFTPSPIPQANTPRELDAELLKIMEESKPKNVSSKADENAKICSVQSTFKSCKEDYLESKIVVKLNDNTSLVLDRDLSSAIDTNYKESNKVNEDPNTGTLEITVKGAKSNENEEAEKNISNINNTLSSTYTKLNANITNSYVGKIIKTYMPKRKDKLNNKRITNQKSKDLKENMTSISTEKRLKTIKYKNINKIKVNIYAKDDFSKNLKTKTFIPKSIMNSDKNNMLRNQRKCTSKISDQYERTQLGELDKLTDYKDDSNTIDIDDFIARQTDIHNTEDTGTAFGDTITEMFGNPNVKYTSSSDMYIESSPDNMDSALDIESKNMNFILDLDNDICTDVNTFVDLDLSCRDNLRVKDDKNTEDGTVKTDIKESIMDFKDSILKDSNKLSLMKQNLETAFVNNIDSNLFSKYDKTVKQENLNISNRDLSMECNKNMYNIEANEMNEVQILNTNDDFNDLYTEMFTNADFFNGKCDKDDQNVSPRTDEQNIILNEYIYDVDSITNTDTNGEFNLSFLLSNSPISSAGIQSVDSNSLDGIEGNPNWIQLPSPEIPRIIEDIFEQRNPFVEKQHLSDKVNKFDSDKDSEKDNDIKKSFRISQNLEQIEDDIINNYCEGDKKCNTSSIAQIEKLLISECSDNNETCSVNSDVICKSDTTNHSNIENAECFDLYSEQIDEHIDNCYEKKIQDAKSITEYEKRNNIDLEADQIQNSRTNKYFGPRCKQNENTHREGDDGLGLNNFDDEVLYYEDIFELNKAEYDEQVGEAIYQSPVDQLIRITLEEPIPKSDVQNHHQDPKSSFQDLKKHVSKDINEKIIESVTSNKTNTTEIKSECENTELKKILFEQCYDSECGNNCQYKKHISHNSLENLDIQKYKNTNIRYNVFNNKKRPSNRRKMNFIERHKSSDNDKRKYRKLDVELHPGQYVELRWNETEPSKAFKQEECKKHNELDEQRKMKITESLNGDECELNDSRFDQNDDNNRNLNSNCPQRLSECPECGHGTDDSEFINFKGDINLRVTNPLSLINKDMFISLRDTVNDDNNKISNDNNKGVALESVFAMEFGYVTAIQALERKLKQKIAISEHRLRRVKNLSKINRQLRQANMILTNSASKYNV